MCVCVCVCVGQPWVSERIESFSECTYIVDAVDVLWLCIV